MALGCSWWLIPRAHEGGVTGSWCCNLAAPVPCNPSGRQEPALPSLLPRPTSVSPTNPLMWGHQTPPWLTFLFTRPLQLLLYLLFLISFISLYIQETVGSRPCWSTAALSPACPPAQPHLCRQRAPGFTFSGGFPFKWPSGTLFRQLLQGTNAPCGQFWALSAGNFPLCTRVTSEGTDKSAAIPNSAQG